MRTRVEGTLAEVAGCLLSRQASMGTLDLLRCRKDCFRLAGSSKVKSAICHIEPAHMAILYSFCG